MSSELRRFNALGGAETSPTCEGAERLEHWVSEISAWAEQEGIAIKHVCGLVIMRTNPKTRKREALLVRGTSETEGPKIRWQFPGGYQKPSDINLVDTVRRELKEELPDFPLPLDQVTYLHSYSPQRAQGAKQIHAMHAFVVDLGVSYWEPQRPEGEQSDVNEHEWTSTPFVDSEGQPRRLYPQVDYVLRHVLKFPKGPPNIDTPPPPEIYNGDPRSKNAETKNQEHPRLPPQKQRP